MEQEQLTEVRGFAAEEVDEVEASTLAKLEGLRQEYEVEVEQLGSDLVVGPFFPFPPVFRYFPRFSIININSCPFFYFSFFSVFLRVSSVFFFLFLFIFSSIFPIFSLFHVFYCLVVSHLTSVVFPSSRSCMSIRRHTLLIRRPVPYPLDWPVIPVMSFLQRYYTARK